MSRHVWLKYIRIRARAHCPDGRAVGGIGLAESARTLYVEVGLGFSGMGGKSHFQPKKRAALAQIAPKMKRTSAAPQRWVAPTMWTLPTIRYPTARKASNSSIVAMSVDMEVLADAGSAPKPRTATPNMVAKMMVMVLKNPRPSGPLWDPYVSHNLIDRSFCVGCANPRGTQLVPQGGTMPRGADKRATPGFSGEHAAWREETPLLLPRRWRRQEDPSVLQSSQA